MRIAICDDDKQERDELLTAIHGWDPTRSAEMFVDGTAFLKAARETPHFSIVFLDIYMPLENGVEVAQELKNISPETGIVFTTTSTEHAVEAFSIGAVHYLIKPVTTDGIREAFARIQRMQFEGRHTLSVKSGRVTKLLYLDEISSISSFDHSCIIKMSDGKELETHASLSELRRQLDKTFLQLQRGFLVNMYYIEQMSAEKCRLRSGQEVLLSRKDRTAIYAAYNDFVFSELAARQDSGKELGTQ